MTRLLKANFARLWMSKSLWVCVIAAVALSFINGYVVAVANSDWVYKTGSFITSQVGTGALVVASFFTPLYLGAEYAHGTIRNKLAAGHSRTNCYFASLIPVTSGTLLILTAYCAPLVVMSIIRGNELGMEARDFCMRILIIVAVAIAESSCFTLLGMLITSRFITVAITFALTFVLFQGSFVLVNLLEQTEYTSKYIATESGVIKTEPQPNPAYIKEGALRNILTAVTDVLPNGQMVRLGANQLNNPELYPLYSVGVLAVTTAAGMLIFRRKDLK